MKRRREREESKIRLAIEELSTVVQLKSGDDIQPTSVDSTGVHDQHFDDSSTAHFATMPFLSVCKLFIQVLDEIGPTMIVLRQDIHQNIQRLEMLVHSDPPNYSNLIEILKKEKVEGSAKKSTSCSKACVWLARSMDFAMTLIQKLAKEPRKNMEQAVEESYNVTLKPWHGWISSAAYKVAIKIVPDNKSFITLLMAKDQNCDTLKDELHALVSLLVPFLADLFAILSFYGLDKLKSA